MGWHGVKNGALLDTAERHGFDIMVTGDKSMRHQQNMMGRMLARVVPEVNRWNVVRDEAEAVRAAGSKAPPGTYAIVKLRRRTDDGER
jgi:hypothetical protein